MSTPSSRCATWPVMTAGTRAGKRSESSGSTRRRCNARSGRRGPLFSQQASHLPLLFLPFRPKRPTSPRCHPSTWFLPPSKRHPSWKGQGGVNRLDLPPPILGDVLFSGSAWPHESSLLLVQKSYAHPLRRERWKKPCMTPPLLPPYWACS